MKRVYLVDVLLCHLCGGQRRIVQEVKEGPVATEILAHLGLPTQVPPFAPARLPDQLEVWDTGPPGRPEPESPADCDEQPPPLDFDQRVSDCDAFA